MVTNYLTNRDLLLIPPFPSLPSTIGRIFFPFFHVFQILATTRRIAVPSKKTITSTEKEVLSV